MKYIITSLFIITCISCANDNSKHTQTHAHTINTNSVLDSGIESPPKEKHPVKHLVKVNHITTQVVDNTMCDVVICNKIKRFSLSLTAHLKDHLGKTCFETMLPKSEAVPGKKLDSESRWWQGSHINPTKRSETYVESVSNCH